MTTESAVNLIEIRVDDLAQLFHTRDPFPFREKDLDQQAEEYIVGWARELPGLRSDQDRGSCSRDIAAIHPAAAKAELKSVQ